MRVVKTVLTLVAVSIVALPGQNAWGALVDDLEHIGSTNLFGGQWLYSGDWYDNGNSTILSAVDPTAKDKAFKGSYGGGYPEGSTGNAALLHYKMGTVRPVSGGSPYGNQVAMETRFNADYSGSLDLTGITSISFYAKASQKTAVRVSFATANITDWAFYQYNIVVNTTYQKFAIPVKDLVKPTWGDKAKILDLAKSQAIVWTISTDDNAAATFADEGKLWIDSIVVDPYTYTPPPPYGACETCVGAPSNPPAVNAPIADFEGTSPMRNKLGFYWFTYADAPSQPNIDSSLIKGNTLTTDLTGVAGTNGGQMEFTLGGSWLWDGLYPVDPGVNMKTELFKPLEGAVDGTGATGLYFDYKTTGQFGYVKVQIQTGQVFAGNEAALPFAMVKHTGGEWKSAFIKWSDLVLPKWGEVDALAAEQRVITTRYLKSLTLTVVDKPKTTGTVTVDNVALAGVSTLVLKELSMATSNTLARGASAGSLAASYSRASKTLAVKCSFGVARMVVTDACGKVLAQSDAGSRIGSLNLHGGVYFVRAYGRQDGVSATGRFVVRN